MLESGIVEVFNVGWGWDDLILLWVGEGDLLMLDFINCVVKMVFDNGEMFYIY